MVAHLAPLGHVPLAQLLGDHLSGLYADLRKAGYKPRTVQYVHTTARRALKDAKRWRLVNANVALDADRPARPRPNPQAWSAGQARRYLRRRPARPLGGTVGDGDRGPGCAAAKLPGLQSGRTSTWTRPP